MNTQPLIERRGENFWRNSDTGQPLPFPDDVEAANAIPPDHSRTFRPVYMAHPVSLWPVILSAVSAIICAAVLVWFAVDSVRHHA